MERELAKRISQKITVGDAIKTLQNAYYQINDWNVRSEVNRGLSKGIAFNIFVKGLFGLKNEIAIPNGETFLTYTDNWRIKDLLEKIIWEFGEYLPNVDQITKDWEIRVFSHQEPQEFNWLSLTGEGPEMTRIK